MPTLSSYRKARSITGAPGQLFLAPAAARTVTGNSGSNSGWHAGALAYAPTPQSRLTISAASGTTPTLDVVVQDSPDGVAWTTRDTYPQQTGSATVTRALPTTLTTFVRVQWTIGGTTPSFTFSFQIGRDTAILQ